MSSPRDLLLPGSGLLIADHFLWNDVVTDNNIGQLGWQFTTIGNAATIAGLTSVSSGVLRITTAATADGDGTALHLLPDSVVLEPGFEFGARVRRPVELASLNYRIGLDDSVTATRPTVGVTFESDAGVLSCHTDSATEGDESASVTGHPDLTSGTTEVVNEWVNLYARASGKANAQGGPDEVDFFVNGTHVAKVPCNIDNDEPVEPKMAFWQDSGGADAVIIDVDYYWFFQPVLAS